MRPDCRDRHIAIHDARLRGNTYRAIGEQFGCCIASVTGITHRTQRELQRAARDPTPRPKHDSLRPELYNRWIHWTLGNPWPEVGPTQDTSA